MNDYIMYGIIAVAVLGLYFIFGGKKAKQEEIEMERSEPVEQDIPIQKLSPSETSSVAPIKSKKHKAKSRRGDRLNSRVSRDFNDYDDDLFDMTFSGYYHPYRTLYLFDWFWDNELDEDEYSLELSDDMGFEGAVLADIYFEDGQNIVNFLNEAGEIVGTASLDQSGGVTVNDHEYTVDGDSGQVQMNNGDNEATWSDEGGYNINSDLSDENISVDDEGNIGFASEPVVESVPEHEPVVESAPEPEPIVESAPDISSPTDTSSNTDY